MSAAQSGRFVPFVPRRVERKASDDEAASRDNAVDKVPPQDPSVEPAFSPAGPSCDSPACAAVVRKRAIGLASRACARALREAIARNPLFVARFVDDALRAAGEAPGARVLLRSAESAVCAGRVRCEVVADDTLEPGEVVVETRGGLLRASVDERAEALVRACADD